MAHDPMEDQSSNPEQVDWKMTRTTMALHQFQQRYLPEVRAALLGEELALDNYETTSRVRAVIAEVCDRDRLRIPEEYLHALVTNFILELVGEENGYGETSA